MQPKNEIGRGPLTLTRAVSQLKPVQEDLGHGRGMDQELEIRSLQIALEAKLQESKRRQRCIEAIIQNLDRGIVVADGKGVVTLLNSQGELMLGLARAKVVGQSLHQVWSRSGLPPLPFSSHAHQGRILRGQEVLLQERNPFSSGVICILSDVTSIVQMEEQLKRRQNSALIGDMVARVAHEIRNPLASIELFASLLGGTTQDEVDRHHLAEQISMVVRTLDHLLSNLLVASSPPRVRIQSVSVEKLAQQIRLMAMPAIRERNIQIREQIDPGASTIEGDELMIRQSLLNILLNAIQASSPGGIIEVTSREIQSDGREGELAQEFISRRPRISLSIRDFGGGIDPSDQARVFDPFFSKRKGGTGLGLAIVRQVMEIHGGSIHCESQIGKGTTFQLCFPQGRKSE